MADYIFGYGSLMNSSSRQLTGQTGEALPAIVSGLVRQWGKIDTTNVASPLVVEFGDNKVNGVLLKIKPSELDNFDKREHGYERHALKINQIKCDSLKLSEQDSVWVYVREAAPYPCQNTPVLQTYVDTVLEGCLEVSEEFAQFFIDHTIGWEYPIANDREKPKYVNYAGVQSNSLSIIDKLLSQIIK